MFDLMQVNTGCLSSNVCISPMQTCLLQLISFGEWGERGFSRLQQGKYPSDFAIEFPCGTFAGSTGNFSPSFSPCLPDMFFPPHLLFKIPVDFNVSSPTKSRRLPPSLPPLLELLGTFSADLDNAFLS